jgi:hypothetical protein
LLSMYARVTVVSSLPTDGAGGGHSLDRERDVAPVSGVTGSVCLFRVCACCLSTEKNSCEEQKKQKHMYEYVRRHETDTKFSLFFETDRQDTSDTSSTHAS